MPTYAFKYYILMLFLSCSGMVTKSFSSACHLLLSPQRMFVREQGLEKTRERAVHHVSQVVCMQTFLTHKRKMPWSILNDSMKKRYSSCSDVFLLHVQNHTWFSIITCQLLLLCVSYITRTTASLLKVDHPSRDTAPLGKITTTETSRS